MCEVLIGSGILFIKWLNSDVECSYTNRAIMIVQILILVNFGLFFFLSNGIKKKNGRAVSFTLFPKADTPHFFKWRGRGAGAGKD